MLILRSTSLDWAKQHAVNYGDTDIFPRLFEYLAIAEQWSILRQYLEKENVQAWVARPLRRCLVPKGRFGFRIATQLDPLDALVYAACVYEIAPQIEARRVAKRHNKVFSWRFAPDADGRMYDPTVGYADFQAESQRLITSGNFDCVVTTDISDFYQRIYHHRLENALSAAAPSHPHVETIMRLLIQWSDGASYGLPVGPAPSRLLAELLIADVDDSLRGDGIRFIRFNDDYRIFVDDKADGYRVLSALAKRLYDMHGLTLQPAKTAIMSADEFMQRALPSEEDRELEQLRDRFYEFVASLGLSSEYEDIDINSLTPDQRRFIESLNLAEMLRFEVAQDGEADYGLIRFVLRRAGQVGDTGLVDDVLANMAQLYPVFDTCIGYLKSLSSLSDGEREDIGRHILASLNGSLASELDYHRAWALDLFASSTDWGNVGQLQSLYARYPDYSTRRAITLALGRAHQSHWFTANKNSLSMLSPWEQRAFLAAASCMPPDATRHWYRSLRGRVDILNQVIIRWASAHPFRN